MKRTAIALLIALLPTPALAAPDAERPHAGRLLGMGLRVSDLDRSIRFYTDILGMTVAGRLPHGTLTEVMLGFGGTPGGPTVILMHDTAPGKSPPLVLGNGFDKIVLDVGNLAAVTARMRGADLPVGEVHGSMGVKVLFVTDPDGYRYELIERAPSAAPKG
ncbi:MAG: VOC family protein [Sphingobium sp.]